MKWFTGVLLFTLISFASVAHAAPVIRDIEFPAGGDVTILDNFGEPRSGGRTHLGVDILGSKLLPLVSVVDGRVSHVVIPEASWGYAIYIKDDDGWEYAYLHINNDTPGTDDGMGGTEYAYAPGIEDGTRVYRGQLIGWMGDSGNAESTEPHLHFEMRTPSDEVVDAYPSLIAAQHAGNGYSPTVATAGTPTINVDKNLALTGAPAFCVSGSLIKSPEFSAVYYCGADGKRYVFPDSKTYSTWYQDYKGVQTISVPELAAIPIGGLVAYRPGVRMIKIQSDPKVYAVDRGGLLRWVSSAAIAETMYGPGWAKLVNDVSDAFFSSYTVGDPITTS